MIRGTLRRVLVVLAELALRILPRRNHVVLAGWPSDEGNAVEVARGLIAARTPLVWLDPPSHERLRSIGLGDARFRRLRKRSLRGFFSFATAQCVFFTHGLYGNPRPQEGKTLVNLWHGDGPKMEGHVGEGGRPTVPADFLVGVSGIFAEYRASALGTNPENVVLVGLPRQEQLHWPIDNSALRALGLDPDKPFILWLPTYRATRGVGLVGGWVDGETGVDLDRALEHRIRDLRELGLQIAVKRHPLDAMEYEYEWVIHLTDKSIADAGLTLYQLMGASSGLLTDYSSVWVEYLALDRPIAFLAPDENSFARTRGLYPPDVMEHLPGEKLTDRESCAAFASEVRGLSSDTRARRAEVSSRFQVIPVERPVSKLIDLLVQRGSLTVDLK